jgi:hypothetical protein
VMSQGGHYNLLYCLFVKVVVQDLSVFDLEQDGEMGRRRVSPDRQSRMKYNCWLHQ